MISGEGLRREPPTCSASCCMRPPTPWPMSTRHIKDTSRQGRYHNTKYKALAGDFGLTVQSHPAIGWCLTTVPGPTIEAYKDQLVTLTRTP